MCARNKPLYMTSLFVYSIIVDMKIIKLKNNPNIRDIGGVYKDVKLKEGMLIRGRTLLNLTGEQQSILVNDHNVKTIIDLRSHDEQSIDPEIVIPGIKYMLLPIFERQKEGVSHIAKEKADSLQIYRTLPHMDQIYFDMLHGVSLKNIGVVINTIIKGKDDFHCSEGKDRTGLIAAILLLILGVSRKEIVKDYLTTNKMAKPKAFKYYMRIKYVKFDALFALKVGRTFLAKRKYINVLFDVIKNEYGDLDTFLTNGLDVDLNDIEPFKKKMIIE